MPFSLSLIRTTPPICFLHSVTKNHCLRRHTKGIIPISIPSILESPPSLIPIMKNIAICYGEQAINVSHSYRCNHPSNQAAAASSSLPNPSIQNAVTCIYEVKLSTGGQLLVRLTWCKSNQGFSIGVCGYPFSSSTLKRNSRVMSKKRGSKTFDSEGLKTEVFWDLCKARYGSGPEPVSGFFVAVLANSEPCLVLGDMEIESETKRRISEKRVSEFSLVSRSEHFLGNSVFSTMAKFSDAGSCHNIVIKCCVEYRNPFLSVYVDKKNVIEVKRLKWNFRGNQTIFVDGESVDMMWDVHDWLFKPSLGYALFMFRTRSGLHSRLWLEDKNFEQNGLEKIGFSLLILACRNSD